MRKLFVSVFLSALLAALLMSVIGCDRKGTLSERETLSFYQEAKAEILSGELKERDASPWLREDWKTEEDKTRALDLMEAAAQYAFGREEPEMYGTWFSSRSYCRTCVITCGGEFEYQGAMRTVKTFFVTKYKDGRYLLEVAFEKGAEETPQYVSVMYEEKTKD